MRPTMRGGLVLAAAIIGLDQLSKWWVVAAMRPEGVTTTPFFAYHPVAVTPFFNIVMTWNHGVSFGIFNTDSPNNALILSALSLAIVALLLWWLRRARTPLLATALGGIIGGALGNVVDRLRFGAVADFLDLHAAGYHWPAFNLADSAITVGAALLLADALLSERRSVKPGL